MLLREIFAEFTTMDIACTLIVLELVENSEQCWAGISSVSLEFLWDIGYLFNLDSAALGGLDVITSGRSFLKRSTT